MCWHWHLPTLLVVILAVFLLCITKQEDGVTGKRKFSRRFQMKNVVNPKSKYCNAKDGMVDGAFVEDASADTGNCDVDNQYESVEVNQEGHDVKTTTFVATTALASTTPPIPRFKDQWAVQDNGQTIDVGHGSILRGKIKANWEKMVIYLLDKEDKTLLEFNAKRNEEQTESLDLKWAKPDGKFEEFPIDEIRLLDDKCKCFEIYFEFLDKGIKIMLNGNPLDKKPEVGLNETPVVKYIMMDADITGTLELNQTTWTVEEKTGSLFDLKGNLTEKFMLTIRGKFFDKAENMQISLISTQMEGIPTQDCWEDLANGSCLIVMDIKVELSQNNISLNSQLLSNLKFWNDRNSQSVDGMEQFMPGKTFELTIRAMKEDKNFVIDKIPLKQPFARDVRNAANFVWISLDEGVLFDEPRIE